MKNISVTFDSNVWELIVDIIKLNNHTDVLALKKIKEAIESKKILPYISDVVVTLEAIRKSDRANYIKKITTTMKQTQSVMGTQQDGYTLIYRKINIVTNFDHHPGLHEYLSIALNEALKLGFQFINVPRIAWIRLDENIYKPQDILKQKEILTRTFHAARVFEREGLGIAHVLKMGEKVLQQRPNLAQQGIGAIRAFSYSDDLTKIPSAVAEWADGDAMAAHYGHNHDVFCTLDRGRNAGQYSVLHENRRIFLKSKFGIQILTPNELSEYISNYLK